jgi:hypothetical protein
MIETLNRLTNGQAPLAIAVAAAILIVLFATVLRRSRPILEGGPWDGASANISASLRRDG